jgi:hypothetical protein
MTAPFQECVAQPIFNYAPETSVWILDTVITNQQRLQEIVT